MDFKSEALCLFDEKDVQLDITGNIQTDYHPTTSLTSGGPIEFFVPGTIGEYVDLSDMQLFVRARILQSTGKALTAKDDVTFINQPISSLFQDVYFMIHDKQVEGGQHCYPYNGYISSLLQFHPSAKKTHMACWGWEEDKPGTFDDPVNNTGYKMRKEETEESSEWELLGPLFLDLTRQSRYLLPQVDLRVKLHPAKADFVLQSPTAGANYKYQITKAILYVRRMRVKDEVVAGHTEGLKLRNASYHINHVDITSFTINAGVSNYVKDQLYASQTPKLLIVGMLDHAAFNGSLATNPFNFQHFDVDKIGLYRDGELVPGQVFTPDFDKDLYSRSYAALMRVLNLFNTDDSNGLTLEHFKNGYTLFGFDLTPDAQCSAPYRSIHFSSSLRLEMNFSKALPKTITVMLFAVFDSRVEITALRDIITSYAR